MDGDGVVEVALGRTHANGDGKALQHFIGAGTDDVAADDSLLRPDADELHVGAGLAGGQGVIHRREIGDVDLDGVAVLQARLALAQAHGADRRVGEYDGRDHLVFQAALAVAAEQSIAQPPPGGDRDGRQGGASGDVADRIDARDRGVLEAVGGDESLLIERHPGRLQAEVRDIRRTSDGPQQAVEPENSRPSRRDERFGRPTSRARRRVSRADGRSCPPPASRASAICPAWRRNA